MREDRTIALLMAADEAYAAPLAVCVASLLERLPQDVGVHLFLIGPGLTPPTLARLEAWWRDRVTLREFLVPSERLSALRDLVGARAVPAHLRAFLGSTLPAEIEKVIYLDADLLVLGDVRELWELNLEGQTLLATQDTYVQDLPRHCLPPGEPPCRAQPYFNSGVMVIDVRAWRASGVEAAYLDAVRRVGHHSRWADQDALNASLVGRWGTLPPRWNRQFALRLYPDWRCAPHSEEEFREARSAPAIVHFCSRSKPWHPFCDHPEEEVRAFRSWLQRVPLDVHPVMPGRLDRTLERFARPHRLLLDTIAAAVRSRQRRHALAVMLPGILRVAATYPWTIVSVPLAILRDRPLRRGGPKRP